jgi:hypothetical protein
MSAARRRCSPRELAETGAIVSVFVAGVIAAAMTGTLWTVAVVYLIPARIALGALAWWFDWLAAPRAGSHPAGEPVPRHPRPDRPGVAAHPSAAVPELSPGAPPAPSIQFYRSIKAWKRNEEAYLERDAAIRTGGGG